MLNKNNFGTNASEYVDVFEGGEWASDAQKAFSLIGGIDPISGTPKMFEWAAGGLGGGSSKSNAGWPLYCNLSGDFTATVKTANRNIITIGSLTAFALSEGNVYAGSLIVDGASIPVSDITILGNDITFNSITDFSSGWLTTSAVVLILYGPFRAYDSSYDAQKTLDQRPDLKTAYIELCSEQDVTTSWVAAGGVHDVSDGTHGGLLVVADVNTSENVSIKMVALDSLSGTEYEIADGPGTIPLWTTTPAGGDFMALYSVAFPDAKYVKFYIKCGTLNTAADLSIKFNVTKGI